MADATSTLAHLKSDPGTPAGPEWVVTVSRSEIARGELTPQNDGKARIAMHAHGCVLLRGAFPLATVEAMHREYIAHFGSLNSTEMRSRVDKPPPNRFMEVGEARYEIILPMTGGFGNTEVFANDLLLKFLAPLLGRDLHLNSFTAVVSHPGAQQQRVHRDYPHLFVEPGVGPSMLPHAVNVVVPLIDVDIQTGPTGVWLGSHRSQGISVGNQPMTVCALQRGDCIVLDYRTLHAGLPNQSSRARPIVYMVYARPWFFDHENHVNRSRVPVDMQLDCYNRLPASVRPLMARASYYRMLARWDEADAPAPTLQHPVDDPPNSGKVGRNGVCPCGSGKKYKHCHGRIS